jgi:hypothetical protein
MLRPEVVIPVPGSVVAADASVIAKLWTTAGTGGAVAIVGVMADDSATFSVFVAVTARPGVAAAVRATISLLVAATPSPGAMAAVS